MAREAFIANLAQQTCVSMVLSVLVEKEISAAAKVICVHQ